jgi:hypothetical protein
LDYRITLTGPTTLTVSNALYTGSSVIPANLIFSEMSSTNNASLVTSFDGLAFGWRYTGVTGDPASTLDVTSAMVSVPEPSAGVLLLGGLGYLVLVHRCRRCC